MMSFAEARTIDGLPVDPTFEEFLSDPMVRLLMRRDHIRVDEARRLFRDTAARLRDGRQPHGAVASRDRGAVLSA